MTLAWYACDLRSNTWKRNSAHAQTFVDAEVMCGECSLKSKSLRYGMKMVEGGSQF